MVIPTSDAIQRFEMQVNELLGKGAALAEITAEVDGHLADIAPESRAELLQALQQAMQPTQFTNQRLTQPDARFAATYALLEHSFDEAERDPYDRFLTMLAAIPSPHNDHPLIMLDRYTQVPGTQHYSDDGVLQHFTYAPDTMTELTVSLVDGNYMSLVRASSAKEAIGAIGHLATRLHFRYGQGHGSNLLQAFEDEVVADARQRGEVVKLFVLEAEPDSQGFWYKQGYRWVNGTNYAQPPLDFDPVTGVPLHAEVPETLMVKMYDAPDATTVDTTLIKDTVKMMYENWCIEKAEELGPIVTKVASDYVFGKVYRAFCASLPTEGPVALTKPPLLD
jgi:hypothetical protein